MATSPDLVQRSDAWFEARLGKITASCTSKVMAKLKTGKPSAERENYLVQLGLERLTGNPTEGFCNAAMQWGIDTEPQARAAYEFLTDNNVQEIGFVDHPTIAMVGASPDGLVGDSGMLEIKCPNSATHWNTWEEGKIDRKYILQMQTQMMCCEREWCDFVSYDPRFPEEHKLFLKRVERDDKLIAEIEAEFEAFLEELDMRVSAFRDGIKKEAA